MEATKIESPHSDSIGHTLALMNVVGSRSFHFMHESLKSLEAGSRPRGKKVGETETSINASLALVQAIQPQDEVEAALAIQMSGVHSLASELLGLAKQTDRTDHIALYAGLAVKLYRTFAMQIEALAKLRGGTKQQVEVRHVYVNGNAVIGNVSRGGGNAAVEHQPHAPGLEAPTVSALPCPFEAVGAAVPVTSYARQEALPDARRK